MVNYTVSVKDIFGNSPAVVCSGDAVIISSGYQGANSMEYFVR